MAKLVTVHPADRTPCSNARSHATAPLYPGHCLRVEVALPERLGPDLISGRLIKELSRAGSGGRNPKDGVVVSGLFHHPGHDVLP